MEEELKLLKLQVEELKQFQLAPVPAGERTSMVDDHSVHSIVHTDNSVKVDARSQHLHVHAHAAPVHINFWGQEDVSFLDKALVKELLKRALEETTTTEGAVEWLYSEVMRLTVSDPRRPENLTAFIPNKRDGTPIVHEADGWNVRPRTEKMFIPLVARALDQVFMNQPFDEDHAKYGPVLAGLRDSEAALATGRTVPTYLENNKERLLRLLGLVPKVGTPPTRQIATELIGALGDAVEAAK